MKNVKVVEIKAGSLDEGLQQLLKHVGQDDEKLQGILEEVAQEIKEQVEAEGHLLKEAVLALKATIRDTTRKLDHAKECKNCGRHTEANAALEVFKAKMEVAVGALNDVIAAEEAVRVALKNTKGVK